MTDKRLEDPLHLTQRYMFGDLLNRLGLHGEGAEIGVYKGEFSIFVASKVNMRHLYLIDRWRHDDNYVDMLNLPDEKQEANFQGVVKLFSAFPNVSIIRDESLEAAKKFKDGGLDWVHIDADHSYEACKADIEAWAQKVRVGGIVAGHDYLDSSTVHFGVKSAVDEYVAYHGYDLRISMDKALNIVPTWYFIKDH
jgi:hypothetical protein